MSKPSCLSRPASSRTSAWSGLWPTIQMLLIGTLLMIGIAIVVPWDLLESAASPNATLPAGFVDLNSVRTFVHSPDKQHVWIVRYPSTLEKIEPHSGKILSQPFISQFFNGGIQLTAAIEESAVYYHNGKISVKPLWTQEPADENWAVQYDWIATSLANDLLVASRKSTIELWSIPTRTCLQWKEMDCAISRIVWSPDGRSLLVKLADGQLHILDGVALAAKQSCRVPMLGEGFMTWAQNGQHIAAFSPYGLAMVWDLVSDELQSSEIEPAFLHAAALHPDGFCFVVPTHEGDLWLFKADGTDRQLLGTTSSRANALSFTADGESLLVGCIDGRVECWSIPDGAIRWSLESTPLTTGPANPSPPANAWSRSLTPAEPKLRHVHRGCSWASTRS